MYDSKPIAKGPLSPGNTEAEPETLITLQLRIILLLLPHLLKKCHFILCMGGQLHTPYSVALIVNVKDF